jgi:hypothetical protein
MANTIPSNNHIVLVVGMINPIIPVISDAILAATIIREPSHGLTCPMTEAQGV